MDSLSLLVAHLVGDYLLQNDWMADNKKISSLVCSIHVTLYILPFLFVGLSGWQLFLIFIQHWFQDRTHFVFWWMCFAGQQNLAREPLAPWGIVIIDNTFHLLWIIFVFRFGA